MPRKKKPELTPEEKKLVQDSKVGWEKSDAKAAAYAAIIDGEIPVDEASDEDEEDLEVFFHCRPEIAGHGERRLWKSRLKGLRQQIAKAKKRADEDEKAFNVYIKNHPKHTVCAKGNYPEWEGHEAQTQLKKDLAEGLLSSDETGPMDLWEREDREVYGLFPLQVFRDHIYQELRTGKYLRQLASNPGKYGNKWKEFTKQQQKEGD